MANTVELQFAEYLCQENGSSKYWRSYTGIVDEGRWLATHYGKIGTFGKTTVKHFITYDALSKFERSKERKGYELAAAFSFEVPSRLAIRAASTNERTGNGGTNPWAGLAVVAYGHAYARSQGLTRNPTGDPLFDLIQDEECAYKAGLGAHAGIAPEDSLTMETTELEGLAGLLGDIIAV